MSRGPVRTRGKLSIVHAVVACVVCAAVLVGIAGCGQEKQQTQAPSGDAEASAGQVKPEDADAVRALSAAYWEAWNAYDVDKDIEKLKRWKMSISVN